MREDGPLPPTTKFDREDASFSFEDDLDVNGESPTGPLPPRPPVPECIGRYRIERVLGRGGYGLVYLAHDAVLERFVAIKVPHANLVSRPEDAEQYLAEARTVASLDHPCIVPVHDFGTAEDHPCFVVSKYIEGEDLAARIRRSRLPVAEVVKLVATVAEALHYAHRQGLVHRDIKPGNILLDTSGTPYIVDFGLALREQDVGKGGPRYIGTTAYMSPEQARGEGHRVDGRSDIFSLAIVLYEMLVGFKPFRADTKAELLDSITTLEPKPPRQYDESIPRELDRICLKALSKKASERYSTAKDMADDLRHFLAGQTVDEPSSSALAHGLSAITSVVQPPSTTGGSGAFQTTANSDSDSRPIKIVPKGLRSFDEHDADFFLELLPGPRDRDGLPDSLRFWKTRIEEKDADKTFSVGLIYGPSGCGKSSLVKAGLLPRLSDGVIAVYVEATPDETEVRLLNGVRKHCPGLPGNLSLKETLAALRQGQGLPEGKKVLIVLDQFEQWLHAKKDEQHTELMQALRQCDGERVQCVVMVRDDFWLSVSRFLQELEVRLLEGQNSALVDLFDMDHARKVLAAFGRAFGKLPESGATSKDQKEFLNQAVSGLAQEGKVISVRLALFAEMMRGKAWTPAKLREVGGTEGVGVTFLEETFSATTAPPEHRLHQKAARAVLNALLPESGTDIRGHMRSYGELLNASGYDGSSPDFTRLIQILNREIRLITPTDPEGIGADEPSTSTAEGPQRFYQLTHDYLVPSLRDWLTRKQRETRRGRAELRLAERSALWIRKPERKQLPSWGEWLNIRLLTRHREWTQSQQQMMAVATRLHFQRMGLTLAAALVLIAGGVAARHFADRRARHELVDGLVSQLWRVELRHVPGLLDQWAAHPERRRDEIARVAGDASRSTDQRARAHLALARDDDGGLDFLLARLLEADIAEHKVYRGELARWTSQVVPALWRTARNDQLPPDRLLRATAALAEYDPGSPDWEAVAPRTIRLLVNMDPLRVNPWIDSLYPARSQLFNPLTEVYHASSSTPRERLLAASILASFVGRDDRLLDVPSLAALLLDAEPESFRIIEPILRRRTDSTLPVIREPLLSEAPLDSEPGTGKLLARQANAVEILYRMGDEAPFWDHLGDEADPRLRTILIERLSRVVGDWRQAFARLPGELNPRIRQAIILGIAGGQRDLSTAERSDQTKRVLELFRHDPDAGVHAAAEWLLRSLVTEDQLAAEIQRLAAPKPADRSWSIAANGMTLTHIPKPGLVIIGSPPSEARRDVSEQQHEVSIDYSFAISECEVTIEQFLAFRPDFQYAAEVAARTDCPINRVDLYDAIRFCRWLSEQEPDFDPQKCCYPPQDEIRPGVRLADDYLVRGGYRLPTVTEWEYAARANSKTSRFFGNDESDLDRFGWWARNSGEVTQPVGRLMPNSFGLFDVFGNVLEWCHQPGRAFDPTGTQVRGGDYRSTPKFLRSAMMTDMDAERKLSIVGFRVVKVTAPQ